jgi:hypothetical protein
MARWRAPSARILAPRTRLPKMTSRDLVLTAQIRTLFRRLRARAIVSRSSVLPLFKRRPNSFRRTWRHRRTPRALSAAAGVASPAARSPGRDRHRPSRRRRSDRHRDAKERGVVGETPNLAARLQGMAPANGVLIAGASCFCFVAVLCRTTRDLPSCRSLSPEAAIRSSIQCGSRSAGMRRAVRLGESPNLRANRPWSWCLCTPKIQLYSYSIN